MLVFQIHIGFAIGDKGTGKLWAIAVLPDHTGKGVGSRLLSTVEEWLFEAGCTRLWLTTVIDTKLKAYSFYLEHGWRDDKIVNGNRYMVKKKV